MPRRVLSVAALVVVGAAVWIALTLMDGGEVTTRLIAEGLLWALLVVGLMRLYHRLEQRRRTPTD